MSLPARALAALADRAERLHREGERQQAEALYLQVLAAQPKHSKAGHNLALLLAETGRAREAQRRLDRLVKAQPNEPALHLLLGRLLAADRQDIRSLFHLRRAVALSPNRPETWLDAIMSLATTHRLDPALAMAEQALARFPTTPEFATHAATALLAGDRPSEARLWLQRALAIAPDHAPALHDLAVLSQSYGAWGDALRLFRRAEAADPAVTVPRTCLGDLELKLGDVPAAIASLESWLQTHPHDAVAISNRLMAAQYVPGVTSHALRTLHRLWQDRIGDAIPLLPPLPPRSTPSRLRIGLVSGDLRAHPVGIFTIRAIEALSRHDVDIIAYSGTTAPDAITERFHACTTHWHDIAAWSDAQLAATIRHDAIDVLIDMAGHTTDIRLAAFARRPAPVQLSWAGYFGTTGCAAIDGVIADHRLVPAGEEKDYPETIWRLPNAYLCYDPPADAPPVLPRDPASPLNLAAFHHPAKINKSVVALWAQILHRHAQAVLHLTYDGLDDPDTKARITAWFAAAQIVPDRLVFRGRLPRAEYFALLGTMDIALDPLPYSGGAITCDALWMGVPVVTLPGASFASRHSQTHLLAAGLDAWVARDADDYVAIALRWATDPSALATLRHRLRAQVEASALCDGPVFGADLLTLLRSAATSDTLLPAP